MIKKRILITGGNGMLGSALAIEAAAIGMEVRALGRDHLDVRNEQEVARHLDWIGGGWIAHCAALVDVEGCAREPDLARETIVEGTRHVAKLAASCDASLLYPQSFLVYDGRTNPIPEDEQPRPLSLYGQLKLEAELVARDLVDDPLVVRMAGFFGGESADKNFVGRIIPTMHAALLRGETEFSVGDRVWQPTWTRDLAQNSIALMNQGVTGTYQMACQGHATFADLAQEIVNALGWQQRFRIIEVSSSAVAQSELGRRPDVAILTCERLTREKRNMQRSWPTTLHSYLSHPFFDQYRLETTA